MLLAWEIRKTRGVMDTRDISLAVTNPLAYRTYSVRSYAHFCLLRKIKSSTKWGDVVIFYVFYTLKGKFNYMFVVQNVHVFYRLEKSDYSSRASSNYRWYYSLCLVKICLDR